MYVRACLCLISNTCAFADQAIYQAEGNRNFKLIWIKEKVVKQGNSKKVYSENKGGCLYVPADIRMDI